MAFLIGDLTGIVHSQAWKTEYIGTLKDGKTKGFWALIVAIPYRGCTIPCGIVIYSSRMLAQRADARNFNRFRGFAGLKDLLRGRLPVLDREFSYLELTLNFMEEQVNWVIYLNLRFHLPKFYDVDGREIAFIISPGETADLNKVW